MLDAVGSSYSVSVLISRSQIYKCLSLDFFSKVAKLWAEAAFPSIPYESSLAPHAQCLLAERKDGRSCAAWEGPTSLPSY